MIFGQRSVSAMLAGSVRRRLHICCLALAAGCTATRARAEFAKAHHCNPDMVTVAPRDDLHFHVSGCGEDEDLDCRSQPCIKVRRAEKRAPQAATLPAAASVDLTPLNTARDTEIHRCYEQAWKTNPALTGHVFIEFTVEKDGEVSHAKVARSSLNDQTLEACVVKKVAAVKFAPRSEPANMSVPFIVRP